MTLISASEGTLMLALPGTWQVLRAIGAHAVRGLAAVEPRGWNRQAQQNAASAAASARAWRLEAEDDGLWTAPRVGVVRRG